MDYRTTKNLTYLARGTSENLKIFQPLICIYSCVDQVNLIPFYDKSFCDLVK